MTLLKFLTFKQKHLDEQPEITTGDEMMTVLVQAISEEDAIAEGINMLEFVIAPDGKPLYLFRRMWDSTNAKRGFGWAANPWVWVVEFMESQRQAGGLHDLP